MEHCKGTRPGSTQGGLTHRAPEVGLVRCAVELVSHVHGARGDLGGEHAGEDGVDSDVEAGVSGEKDGAMGQY